ncbi:MAG TPA: AAA family ATPase, partial [Candidatus Dormibacteraeota bacterium]|nr:AAA family ATPase [Candidatus Dormibacteraeota bacterium]
MHCPSCAHINPPDARFCSGCGASLSVPATDRMASLRAFIPSEVAEKLLAAGGEGERRTVSVLFCDVVGSTALGERLGPERFKVVMDQLLGRLIMAVSRYEGTIAQVMGDGLLAFFGAPLAHEDDPERALNASLDIRAAVSAYARDLEAAYAVSIAVRIGLHTGPVVLSRVTDVLQVAYNSLGDTVITAARLQSAAAPGTILASEATSHLIAPLFELRPVSPLLLKGKSAPVAAVEVLAARADAGKPRGITGLSSPLVGRDQDMDALMRSVQAVTEGRGQIVALLGEAGLGKSRLIAEVRKATPAVRWLEGRSLSYAGGIPYFPFLDLLREWLGVTSADPEAKVRIELRAALDGLFGARAADIYLYFGALLGIALEPEAAGRIADLSAESLQHQTFLVLREWASRVATRYPLGLILDDLHWADPTSLALLEALLEVTEEAALLLCLVFRPERGHGCWHLNDVARQRFPHRHAEIALCPLGPSDTEQLVSNLLAFADFPVEVRDLINQKAEGNPFFIEEVIRELIEARVLVREGNRWCATRQVSSLEIPDSVQGVLLSRMDRLPTEAKRVLQAASVIGRLFPLDILREIVGGNGRLQTALGDLQRHELIIERRRLPQAEYRFTHALTQEVAYSTLLEGESRRLHRAVALALETAYADRLEEVYGLLAYHYDRSEDEVRALQFLVRAGDKARGESAHDEALRLYSRAVEIMKRRGELRAAAETLMKAALAHHIAFDFRAAGQAYCEAFTILEGLPPARAPNLEPCILRMSIVEPGGLDIARVSDAPSAFLVNQLFE